MYQRLSLKKCILLFIIVCITACSSFKKTNSSVIVISETLLPQTLHETSGLYCDSNNIYTINDSGNEPVIYILDTKGNVKSEIAINTENIDWEAISSDGNKLYVGDFGNNSGNRTNLGVLIHNTSTGLTEQLSFSYADTDSITPPNDGDSVNNSQSHSNRYKAHDMDAEALVVKNNTLIIFSKSWKTGVAKVYQIYANEANQILTPVTSIAGLPGIITGADWDKHTQQFVVVGYKVSTFSIQPFIAILDTQYNITRIEYLKGFSQVEGVCAINGEYWFTQEKFPFYPAKLVKIRF